jgi:hypothetical protein
MHLCRACNRPDFKIGKVVKLPWGQAKIVGHEPTRRVIVLQSESGLPYEIDVMKLDQLLKDLTWQ